MSHDLLLVFSRQQRGILRQIHHAAQNPVELDRAQADAVDARIVLDLRLGVAFTRMQSLILQARFQELGKQIISYGKPSVTLLVLNIHGGTYALGPCQFPTLGFVVSRYEQVQSFSPENFWYIYLSFCRLSDSKASKDVGEETEFTWRRGRLFEFDVSLAIYEGVVNTPMARVTSVTQKPTKKWQVFFFC